MDSSFELWKAGYKTGMKIENQLTKLLRRKE